MHDSGSGTGTGRSGCDDIETLYDTDAKNICAVISRHRRTGDYTVAVFKQFERDDELVKTSFIPKRLIPAAQRVLMAAEARCTTLEELDKAHPGRAIPRSDHRRRAGGRS